MESRQEANRSAPEAALLRSAGSAPEAPPRGRYEPTEAPVEGEEALVWVQRGMRGGWHLLRQEPSLALWPVLAQGLQSVITLAPLLVIAAAVLAKLGIVTSDSGLVAGLLAVWHQISSPGFLIGAGGLWGTAWVAAWVLGVAALSGVLGALLRRLQAGRVVIAKGVFWRSFGQGFGVLLGWSLLRGLCLTAAAGVGAGSVALGWGLLAGSAAGIQAAGVAALGAVAAALLAGVTLVFQVALPYISRGEHGVFGALGAAAWLIARRPAEALWLHGLELGLCVVVLAIYIPFALLFSALGADPALAVVGSLGRFALDLFYAAAVSVVSVWAWGATSTWVGLCEGWWRGVPASHGLAAAPAWAQGPPLVTPAVVPSLEEARALLPAAGAPAPTTLEAVQRTLLAVDAARSRAR